MAIVLQLNQRPAILQAVGEVIFGLTAVLLFTALLLGAKIRLPTQKVMFASAGLSFIVYLVFQTLMTKDGVSVGVINNALLMISALVSVMLIDKNTWIIALKAIVYPVLLFSLSYSTTLVLVLVTSLSLPDLSLFSFQLQQGASAYVITAYAPFSPAVGFGNVAFLDVELARAIGYFREPGIFQLFIIVSYFGIDYLDIRYAIFWRIALILTLLLTFSTAGIGAFIATYIYYYGVSRRGHRSWKQLAVRLSSVAAIIPLCYWFIFADDKIGLLSKMASGSGVQRTEPAAEAWYSLLNNPIFGIGYLNPELSGITFLSVAGQIGVLGVVLFTALWLGPNLDMIKRRDPRLCFLIPLVLTAMLAQPLFDKPIFIILAGFTATAPRGQVD